MDSLERLFARTDQAAGALPRWVTDDRATAMAGTHVLQDPAALVDAVSDMHRSDRDAGDSFAWLRLEGGDDDRCRDDVDPRWMQCCRAPSGGVRVEVSDGPSWPDEVRPLTTADWTPEQAAHIGWLWVRHGALRADAMRVPFPRPEG